MPLTEPWSKKHKQLTRHGSGGMPYSLSNSYAQPLTQRELVEFTLARGDHELVEEYNNHTLEYTPNGGSPDLRHEISQLYGPKINAENILIFAGGQVALATAAHALTNSHTHAVVFDPAYQSTQEAPVHAGSQVTRVQLSASTGWQIDPSATEAAMREHTKLLLINEPYNPAGTLMSRERQAQLVAVAARRGVYILSDEIYRLLEHDPADRIPAMADLYERGEHRSLQPHAPSLQPHVPNLQRHAPSLQPHVPSLRVTPRAQGSAWGRSPSRGAAAASPLGGSPSRT
tara:strand:+ start:763 stop:1623 length:861 start_codon:yes stop_codon:yes gene_type:complete